MPNKWVEKLITGPVEQKRQWRAYKASREQLPPDYRTAMDALERYIMYYGGISSGAVVMEMLEDLGNLFAESAANRMPLRDVVGEDPVEFADTFVANYSEASWFQKEHTRLRETIDGIEQ
jgi:DNA-binding ferritin-like protein (Dps family)